MLKNKSVNIALLYIRKNVTLDRIKEVEETLSDWMDGNLLDLDDYFNQILMESVYRSHKGSYKIDSSKCRGLISLGFILYILFGEPKFNPDEVMSEKVQKRFKQILRNRFEKDSYFLRYFLKFLDVKIGDRDEKTGWVNIEPYIYSILGGEIFFYCTLRALMEISKKALTDKKYDYQPPVNWKEGVVDYLVNEAIEWREDS